MDKFFLESVKTFSDIAENLLSYAPKEEDEWDDMDKNWQEFFEECANVINTVHNLPEMEG